MTVQDTNTSARAAITRVLDQFGLGSLAGWAWQRYVAGVPVEQIMLDLRERPEYRARFPAMRELADRGRAITENEYLGTASRPTSPHSSQTGRRRRSIHSP